MKPVELERLLRSPEPVRWSAPSPEELEELRTMPYSDYLETPYWRWVRRRALWLARYHCQGCGTRRGVLHVHHVTYERRGQERDEDLLVLCQDCHKSEHKDPRPPWAAEFVVDLRRALAEWERRDVQQLAGEAPSWDG